MYVCSDGHADIVHEGTDCPLCETIRMLQDRDDDCTRAEERVGEVEAKLEESVEANQKLQGRVEDLERELENARATIDDLNQELERTLAEGQRLLDMADRRH